MSASSPSSVRFEVDAIASVGVVGDRQERGDSDLSLFGEAELGEVSPASTLVSTATGAIVKQIKLLDANAVGSQL